MGFTSLADLSTEAFTNSKFLRSDFSINFSGGSSGVAGNCYDLQYFGGTIVKNHAPGNYILNGAFTSGPNNWTVGSTYWAWDGTNLRMNHSTGDAGLSTLSQNTSCTNGVTYQVTFTTPTCTAGNVTVSLGGTNGTQRSTAATFVENISCGATANAPLVFTPSSTFVGSINNVSVVRLLSFTPFTDTNQDRVLWHGGNVSTDTKHVLNAGAWSVAATGAPCVLHVVDLLGVYPQISTNTTNVQQLDNTLTLPRYTTGDGVRAYLGVNSTIANTNATYFAMTFTNASGAQNCSLGATQGITINFQVSGVPNSGPAAARYAPFMPIFGYDKGIRSVQSCQFTAINTGLVDLFLCKPLFSIPVTTQAVASERNFLTQLVSLPRIYDGAVLGFIVFAGAALSSGGVQWQGFIEFGWG